MAGREDPTDQEVLTTIAATPLSGPARPPVAALAATALLLVLAGWAWWLSGRTSGAAALEVRTVPRGAALLVGGRVVGRSDEVLHGLEEGKVELVVRRTGFLEARRQVKLERGRTALACFVLEPESGTLRLEVRGPGQFVLASEDETWKTPRSLRLVPGEYRFLLRAPGYRDRSVRTRVDPGREVTLAVRMERLPIPPGQDALLPALPAGGPPAALPGSWALPVPVLPSGRLPAGPPSLPRLSLPTPVPAEAPPAPAPAMTMVPPPVPAGTPAPVPESLMTPVSP